MPPKGKIKWCLHLGLYQGIKVSCRSKVLYVGRQLCTSSNVDGGMFVWTVSYLGDKDRGEKGDEAGAGGRKFKFKFRLRSGMEGSRA